MSSISRVEVVSLVGDTCITLQQGEPVYKAVHELLSANEQVVLDFSGVEVCASPFLNVAVGRLLKDFPPELLDQKLRIERLTPVGTRLLRRVIDNAKRYFHDDPAARKALEAILNEDSE